MIYLAGPLFNEEERNLMERIAFRLEGVKIKVFLPHRDGIGGDKDFIKTREGGYTDSMMRDIFKLDTEKVKLCSALVLNLNGRVPDEGAVSEAAIAWTLGKTVFIYKDDLRSLVNGFDNPLVMGLGDFTIYNKIPQLITAIKRHISLSE